jgi:hypothetical protein
MHYISPEFIRNKHNEDIARAAQARRAAEATTRYRPRHRRRKALARVWRTLRQEG